MLVVIFLPPEDKQSFDQNWPFESKPNTGFSLGPGPGYHFDISTDPQKTSAPLSEENSDLEGSKENHPAAAQPVTPGTMTDCLFFTERLRMITERSLEILDAQSFEIYLLDEATTSLSRLVACGDLGEYLLTDSDESAATRPLANAMADLEALTGHIVSLEDKTLNTMWSVPRKCGSAVCLPIATRTTIYGTLWIYCDFSRPFLESELLELERITGKIGIEVEQHLASGGNDWIGSEEVSLIEDAMLESLELPEFGADEEAEIPSDIAEEITAEFQYVIEEKNEAADVLSTEEMRESQELAPQSPWNKKNKSMPVQLPIDLSQSPFSDQIQMPVLLSKHHSFELAGTTLNFGEPRFCFHDWFAFEDGRLLLTTGELLPGEERDPFMMALQLQNIRATVRAASFFVEEASEVLQLLDKTLWATNESENGVSIGAAILNPKTGEGTVSLVGDSSFLLITPELFEFQQATEPPLRFSTGEGIVSHQIKLALNEELILCSGETAGRMRARLQKDVELFAGLDSIAQMHLTAEETLFRLQASLAFEMNSETDTTGGMIVIKNW